MARTNIDIDDALIGRVIKRYGFRSKREAVEGALRSLDVEPLSREQLLELEGSGWEGDLDDLAADAPGVDRWLAPR